MRILRGALLLGAVLLALWHASPILLWHLSFEGQLRSEGPAERLHTSEERLAEPGPPAWPRLEVGALSLRAPLEPSEAARCGSCSGRCLLRLEGGGTLALFDELPPERIEDALNAFAPDADDLSLLRSFARNWATIDALTDRVRTPTQPPRSFRYLGVHGRGVVSSFAVGGTHRFVVLPYDLQGRPARIVGLTGADLGLLRAMLAGLRVEPEQRERAASCTARGAGS